MQRIVSRTAPIIPMKSALKSRRCFRKFSSGVALATPKLPPTRFIDECIEEQTLPRYVSQLFYPVQLGEVINDRYRIVSKLGYGTSSTVWLARDNRKRWWQMPRWVTLKILTRGLDADTNAKAELDASQIIVRTNPRSKGRRYLRTVLDSFEVAGPHGTHVALVYEPMRESLSKFQRRLPDSKLPGYFLKPLLVMVLTGIDYLHSECHIIHTDLKPDNILLGLESHNAIEELVKQEIEEPTPQKLEGSKRIYPSRNFGDLQGPPGPPKIADFGLAVRGDESLLHTHPIQADLFQAPEVILQVGWSYSADIWNLGIMTWDLVENTTLFDAVDTFDTFGDVYSVERHLEEMMSFLGPPPKDLLRRGGVGASYFTAEGELLRSNGKPAKASSLEANLTAFSGEEKRLFLSFVRKMLRWRPEDRATARELLNDPWLNS